MAKLLTEKEVAEIFKKVTTEDHWIDCSDQYLYFLEATAELCADHFGGEVVSVSFRGDDELGYAIIFDGDENVPDGGGVYAEFDPDSDWSGEPDDFEDGKVLTDKELGQLICNAINNNELFSDAAQYAHFLEDVGDVLADHFGGERGGVSYDEGDGLGYTIAFDVNDSVPSDGGIYKDYDTDVVWSNGEEVESLFSEKTTALNIPNNPKI